MLYPQNGDRIAIIGAVTSFHPIYKQVLYLSGLSRTTGGTWSVCRRCADVELLVRRVGVSRRTAVFSERTASTCRPSAHDLVAVAADDAVRVAGVEEPGRRQTHQRHARQRQLRRPPRERRQSH